MNDTEPQIAPTTHPAILAARFLFPCDDLAHADDRTWYRAPRWFLLCGLLTGLLYAIVFRIAWRCFGEYQLIRFAPMAWVLAADLALGGYCLLAATASLAGRNTRKPSGSEPAILLPIILTVVLIALIKYGFFVSLPMGKAAQYAGWRTRFGFLYPQVIYRPLILMPVWGRWAMMLALSIGRPAPGSTQRLRFMAGSSRLWLIICYWVGCTALTMFYGGGSAPQIGRCVLIALGVLVVTYLASFVLSRRLNGQTETTVRVAGLVGELAFLSLYLPVASGMYWY